MVVCVFEGVVTLKEIMEYLADLESAGALGYRRILDATQGECSLSETELRRVTVHTGSFSRRGTSGPIAVVTGSSRNDKVVTNLRAMTPTDRPLRMFTTIHDARRWLSNAPLGSPTRDARRPT